MYAHGKVNVRVEFVSCNVFIVGNNKIYMHAYTVKNEWYNVADSRYKLNAFVYASEICIVQYKDECEKLILVMFLLFLEIKH